MDSSGLLISCAMEAARRPMVMSFWFSRSTTAERSSSCSA